MQAIFSHVIQVYLLMLPHWKWYFLEDPSYSVSQECRVAQRGETGSNLNGQNSYPDCATSRAQAEAAAVCKGTRSISDPAKHAGDVRLPP